MIKGFPVFQYIVDKNAPLKSKVVRCNNVPF